MKISIIIPVYNEAESLVELHEQIDRVSQEHSLDVEIIFVDDGSRDGSWNQIQQLVKRDVRVRGLRFRRNFGKAAALTAGIRAAESEIIFMMDADLQDDPAEIPAFVKKMIEGYDVVNGWKMRRLDPWHKVYPSLVFNWMIARMTGLELHDHNCGLKLFKAEVGREIRLYGELHRFIPVLANARGFRVTEVAVNHRVRKHGESKYGVRRFLRGFLDLITVTFLTGYGQRPQHMLGAAGLGAFALGFLGLGYLAVTWIFMNVIPLFTATPIGNRPLLAYSIALTLLGAQAMSLGLIAELIVHYTSRDSDTYSVSDEIGAKSGDV
jgi:glycosyltransferase involved in cell wall biosynthesis